MGTCDLVVVAIGIAALWEEALVVLRSSVEQLEGRFGWDRTSTWSSSWLLRYLDPGLYRRAHRYMLGLMVQAVEADNRLVKTSGSRT